MNHQSLESNGFVAYDSPENNNSFQSPLVNSAKESCQTSIQNFNIQLTGQYQVSTDVNTTGLRYTEQPDNTREDNTRCEAPNSFKFTDETFFVSEHNHTTEQGFQYEQPPEIVEEEQVEENDDDNYETQAENKNPFVFDQEWSDYGELSKHDSLNSSSNNNNNNNNNSSRDFSFIMRQNSSMSSATNNYRIKLGSTTHLSNQYANSSLYQTLDYDLQESDPINSMGEENRRNRRVGGHYENDFQIRNGGDVRHLNINSDSSFESNSSAIAVQFPPINSRSSSNEKIGFDPPDCLFRNDDSSIQNSSNSNSAPPSERGGGGPQMKEMNKDENSNLFEEAFFEMDDVQSSSQSLWIQQQLNEISINNHKRASLSPRLIIPFSPQPNPIELDEFNSPIENFPSSKISINNYNPLINRPYFFTSESDNPPFKMGDEQQSRGEVLSELKAPPYLILDLRVNPTHETLLNVRISGGIEFLKEEN